MITSTYQTCIQTSMVSNSKQYLFIGCFGATRPFKNQLEQAAGALIAAKELNRRLVYFINGSRVEYNGEGILRNIRALFTHQPDAELVEIEWMSHDEFIRIVGSMDVNLQVSYTETFNIVAADSVTAGVPVIGSSEIDWLPAISWADPNNAYDMADKIKLALRFPKMVNYLQKRGLKKYNQKAFTEWNKFLEVTEPEQFR